MKGYPVNLSLFGCAKPLRHSFDQLPSLTREPGYLEPLTVFTWGPWWLLAESSKVNKWSWTVRPKIRQSRHMWFQGSYHYSGFQYNHLRIHIFCAAFSIRWCTQVQVIIYLYMYEYIYIYIYNYIHMIDMVCFTDMWKWTLYTLCFMVTACCPKRTQRQTQHPPWCWTKGPWSKDWRCLHAAGCSTHRGAPHCGFPCALVTAEKWIEINTPRIILGYFSASCFCPTCLLCWQQTSMISNFHIFQNLP